MLHAHVDQAALTADAHAVEDVELGLLERRGDLVLDDLDPGAVADRLGAVLQGLDPADVQPDRGVELQRPATGRGLRRAEHDADLLPQLVDEDRGGVRLVQRTGDLPQRLAHQPGLQTDVGVAHLALDLGARHERRHRVDDHQVDRAGADQHVGDLQRLLTGVRLADQQGVGVHAELLGVLRVERVLRVDEGDRAAGPLGVGRQVQGQRGLAGGLRAVDLDHPAARDAADPERDVQGGGTGGDHLDRLVRLLAEAHHRALAELPLDLRERRLKGLLAVRTCHGFHPRVLCCALHRPRR